MTKRDEIASAANVSVKTVSRVLNDRPFVREDVRDRVLYFADVLGYQRKARPEFAGVNTDSVPTKLDRTKTQFRRGDSPSVVPRDTAVAGGAEAG